MAPTAVAAPAYMTDPGWLHIAPLATAHPVNTVAGSVMTDAWAAAWIPLGATAEGSTFNYAMEVEPITVAELFDPIAIRTVGRSGSMAFALAGPTMSNLRRAVNGGIAALTATSGTGATSLFTLTPPTPGNEVRCMIGWESQDNTMRIIMSQTIQGGEIAMEFQKAPALATIPCTFNMEIPTGATSPWTVYGAGVARGGT